MEQMPDRTESPLNITLIANAGLLLYWKNTAILLDALFQKVKIVKSIRTKIFAGFLVNMHKYGFRLPPVRIRAPLHLLRLASLHPPSLRTVSCIADSPHKCHKQHRKIHANDRAKADNQSIDKYVQHIHHLPPSHI